MPQRRATRWTGCRPRRRMARKSGRQPVRMTTASGNQARMPAPGVRAGPRRYRPTARRRNALRRLRAYRSRGAARPEPRRRSLSVLAGPGMRDRHRRHGATATASCRLGSAWPSGERYPLEAWVDGVDRIVSGVLRPPSRGSPPRSAGGIRVTHRPARPSLHRRGDRFPPGRRRATPPRAAGSTPFRLHTMIGTLRCRCRMTDARLARCAHGVPGGAEGGTHAGAARRGKPGPRAAPRVPPAGEGEGTSLADVVCPVAPPHAAGTPVGVIPRWDRLRTALVTNR